MKDKCCRVIEKDGVAWEGEMTIGRIAKEVRELYTFIDLLHPQYLYVMFAHN